MANFWNIVNEVIEEADILLEVLDARFPDETRNPEIEDKVREAGKKLIFVLNKCDLVEQKQLEELKKKIKPSIFVSSTKRFGITMLLHKILEFGKGDEEIIVGVLGYPNTGKSSVINALKGRASAGVSPESGFTKGKQLIKVTGNVYLLDTPGVYPYLEKDANKHVLSATESFDKTKDPEGAALKLVEAAKEKIKAHYSVGGEDADEIIENVAVKMNLIKKKGLPDTSRASRKILLDWQRGKIRQ